MSLKEAMFHLDDESLPVEAKRTREGRKGRHAPTGREGKGESTEDPPQKKMRVTRLDEKGEVVVETFATTRVFFDMPIYLQETMLLSMSPTTIKNLCIAAGMSKDSVLKQFYETFCRGYDFWRRKYLKDFPEWYDDMLLGMFRELGETSRRFLIVEPTVLAVDGSDGAQIEMLTYWATAYNAQFRIAAGDLSDAALAGDYDRVLRYLTMGVDADARGTARSTALMSAEYPAIVELLLKNGADPNIPSGRGMTILASAIAQRETESARLLLQYGANPTAEALRTAANVDSIEIVRMLLQAGADPTEPNRWGRTALDIARNKGFTAIIALMEADGVTGSWTPSHP